MNDKGLLFSKKHKACSLTDKKKTCNNLWLSGGQCFYRTAVLLCQSSDTIKARNYFKTAGTTHRMHV